MSRKWVRASGSRTALDVIRRVLIAGRTPEDDLQDLDAGVGLLVSALRRDGLRWRPGTLLLDLSSSNPIRWAPTYWATPSTRALTRSIRLSPPFVVYGASDVAGHEPGLKPGLFRILDLTTTDEHWALAVPTPDVPLVRHALTAAGQRTETP